MMGMLLYMAAVHETRGPIYCGLLFVFRYVYCNLFAPRDFAANIDSAFPELP